MNGREIAVIIRKHIYMASGRAEQPMGIDAAAKAVEEALQAKPALDADALEAEWRMYIGNLPPTPSDEQESYTPEEVRGFFDSILEHFAPPQQGDDETAMQNAYKKFMEPKYDSLLESANNLVDTANKRITTLEAALTAVAQLIAMSRDTQAQSIIKEALAASTEGE